MIDDRRARFAIGSPRSLTPCWSSSRRSRSTWLMRQGYAVHRLTRGVGDTWFLAADGRPLVPDGRASPRRAARRDSRAPPARLHRRSRITGSTRIPASIRSRSAAPSSGTCASPGTVEGGSTLTQQLARTLFLSNKKTYGRKVREAVLALMIDGQLTKEQVLELYLNRIYLSAGVYGVETMSRHLFGRPAKQLNLAECALIAGLARAPATLSPWSNLDGARRAQPRRARADARRGVHHRVAGARGAADEHPRSGRIRARAIRAAATRRSICASCSASNSAAIIRPTGRCARRSCRRCRTRPSRRCARGLARFNDPELQAALVAIDPRTGNILGARRRARLRAVAVQPREPQPPSAGLGVQAAALRRRARARVLAGVAHRRADDHRAAGARRVVAAQRRRRRRPMC